MGPRATDWVMSMAALLRGQPVKDSGAGETLVDRRQNELARTESCQERRQDSGLPTPTILAPCLPWLSWDRAITAQAPDGGRLANRQRPHWAFGRGREEKDFGC